MFVTCPNCDAPIDTNTHTCPYCYTALTASSINAPWVMPTMIAFSVLVLVTLFFDYFADFHFCRWLLSQVKAG